MPKLFDERSLEILADVLEQTHGSLEGLNVKRYRIDHGDYLDRLDALTNRHLLELDHSQQTVRVGHMGLYFIRNATRDALLVDIDRVLNYLRARYRQTLEDPVRLTDIAEALDLGRNRIEECVTYIRDALTIGVSFNLREPDAFIAPTESLARFDEFEEFLADRARQWFPEPAESKRAKLHGNTEVNAIKREQVLGAALTAIIHWPDECKRGDTFNGAHIANVIDQKARLWWAEGEAPLSIDSMARLINQHLKLPQ